MTEHRHALGQAIALTALLLSIVTQSRSATIFYDSFEDPDTSGRVTNSPTGWVSTRTDKTGINDATIADKTGSQFAYVDDYPNTGLYDGALTTTGSNLSSNLTAWVHYTLTCDVTVCGAGAIGAIDLLAGTNVIASVTNAPATINDFSVSHALASKSSTARISIIPTDSHPNLGQTLAIRLRKVYGAWNADILFDNLTLDATDTTADTNAPTPATMLWHSGPVASANTSITMTATNAIDPNHVQYMFTNTVNGHCSGWLDANIWTDTGLSNGVSYTYKVKARDNSSNYNETAWSSEASATADSAVLLYESFESPPHADVTAAYSTNSQGWVQSGSGYAGLHDEASGKFTTPYGSQAAYVYDNNGTLAEKYSITNLGAVLAVGTQYRLSFNVASENGGNAGYGVDLLAGTNVVATATGALGSSNIAATSVVITFTPEPDDARLGQGIGVRLRKPSGAWNAGHIIYDNILLVASNTASDVAAPTPNPSTWASEPVAIASNQISMIATPAGDPNGVQYFFTNTVNGHVSGWQSSPGWTDTGLSNDVTYIYKVRTRDKSSNLNQSDWSSEKSATASSSVLLYESFESPPHADVTNSCATNSQGWVQSGSGYAGLHDEASGKFTTPYGSQAAYVYDNDGTLAEKYSITNLGAVLAVGTQYRLSFNVASENGGNAGYGVDLLAGTNVVATATGALGSSNIAATSVAITFTPEPDDARLGQGIGVRLRKPTGAWNAGHIVYDNILLVASNTASDVTAPTPDPMTWFVEPVPVAGNSIYMIATPASDPNGVQYFFTNTVNGHVSGWQSSPGWTDTGLSNDVTYIYKVRTRDKSSNLNQSDWSSEKSATASSSVLLYESFESPPHADVTNSCATNSQGWVQSTTSSGAAGLHDEVSGTFTTPYGSQAAYVYDNDGTLATAYTITNMGAALEFGTRYLLSFNVASENSGSAGYGVDLLAGTNVLATATGTPGTNNLAANSVRISFTPAPDDPRLGQGIGVSLRKPTGAWNAGHIVYDNILLVASNTASDVAVPTPDPSTWQEEPVVVSGNSISMIATPASDPNGVQYFFTNTVNGHVSGWQSSPGWTDTGLHVGTTYSYKVKSRDKSSNLNETGWSAEKSILMTPGTIFYDSFEAPPHVDVTMLTPTNSGGWVRNGSYDGGITDEAEDRFATPYGSQAAYVYDNVNTLGHTYRTTCITNVLQAGMTYKLSFNTASEDGGSAGYGVDLLADTNVLATATGAPGSRDMAATGVTITFATPADHPSLGQTLGVQLRKPAGAWNLGQILYDNVRLIALPSGFTPGSDGGGVTYDFVAAPLEVTVNDYVGYLNAMTNSEISISGGSVFLAATSNLLCLTTNAEAKAYVAYDPDAQPGSKFSAITGRGNHPMIYVTWFGAAAYCNWRSGVEGYAAVYNSAGGWTSNTGNSGYRLPTEAEWDKAAAWNAANGTFYVYGTSSDTVSTNDANFLFSGDACEGNPVPTTPVGSYAQVSPYKLYDMSGDVAEWCNDLYSGSIPDVDPHSIRGGSWGHPAERGKAASRTALKPGQPANSVGFRVFRKMIWE